jgi:hypothetical protein
MKTYKVKNLRTHIAGLLGQTSYDSEKHEAEMELWPVGVLIKKIKGKEYNLLEPFGNIIEARLEIDEQAEEKRGPGRPPGSKVA